MSLDTAHWYDRNGAAVHTQKCKSKDAANPFRATTVADAKKHPGGLLPSVSAYTAMLHSHNLEAYKLDQLAEACFQSPPIGAENFKTWKGKMLLKARESAGKAADFGTKVHAAFEKAITYQSWNAEEELDLPFGGGSVLMGEMVLEAVHKARGLGLQVIQAEGVVLNNALGYAGTPDLILAEVLGGKGGFGILDLKTKKTKKGEEIDWIDTHPMQLMAYACAFDPNRDPAFVANLYISSTEPGRVEFRYYDLDEQRRAWQAFLACCELYRYVKNYDARKVT